MPHDIIQGILGPAFCVQNIDVSRLDGYIDKDFLLLDFKLFKVWLIQYSVLFTIQFRQVSL